MKFMGSKRQMLRNGLGEVLERAVPCASRFIDLFTGSAAVARHVSIRHDVPVTAVDLQAFCIALAEPTLRRLTPVSSNDFFDPWLHRAQQRFECSANFDEIIRLQADLTHQRIAEQALYARKLSEKSEYDLCRAYGGWYFSPFQASMISLLRAELPVVAAHASIALASLISVASRSAAAPGHTAQPFNPETRAGKHVVTAWRRNFVEDLRKSCDDIGASHAKIAGDVRKEDAKVFALELSESDLVFIDPPYSAVHYSRFYHVLESVAKGAAGQVSGAGRYPPLSERPLSQFSVKTKSRSAFIKLLTQVSTANAHAIITFPLELASNGLSGRLIKELAQENFHIEQEKISSIMSTLGGDTLSRKARTESVEIILRLAPKRDQVNGCTFPSAA